MDTNQSTGKRNSHPASPTSLMEVMLIVLKVKMAFITVDVQWCVFEITRNDVFPCCSYETYTFHQCCVIWCQSALELCKRPPMKVGLLCVVSILRAVRYLNHP